MGNRLLVKTIVLTAAICAAVLLPKFAAADKLPRGEGFTMEGVSSERSKAAFGEAAKVFFSARCANCHPGGNTPTQFDTMTPHALDVERGPDGRGVGDLKCAVCHESANQVGDGFPPGAPDWHMPKADQKMPFQGITASQLCRNLKDPLQNGGRKTARESVEHLTTDPKVLWAWNPGNNRMKPPLTHDEFIKKMNEWVAGGAECP